MKRYLLPFLLMAGVQHEASAQKYLGVATSNWNATSALYLNPAHVADCRQRLVIDIAGLNVGVDNNLGKLDAWEGIKRFLRNDSVYISDIFNYSNNSKFSLLAPYGEVRGPGIMASINQKHSIALTTRVRGMNQFNNFDQSLYRTINDTNYVTNGDIYLTAQNFNWTGHLWTETALTYGAVVWQRGHHEVKAGVTMRYLTGVGYVGLKGNNMDIRFISGVDSLNANNTDIEYASNLLRADGAIRNGVTGQNFIDQFFGKKAGHGVGADIGVTYDYIADPTSDIYDLEDGTGTPDPTKNRYKIRIGASVTDLGYIRYKTDNNYAVKLRGDGSLTGKGLSENVKDYDDFRNYALQQGFRVDTGKAEKKVYMPTTMILSADYHAWKWLYVNALFMGNAANRNNFGNSYYNTFSITPRIDTRHWSVALPLSYSSLTNTTRVGIGVRAYGFYIGSDDMLGVVSNQQYGLNIYVGGNVTLGKRRLHDKDHDYVTDRKDKCPDEAGAWNNSGCPDTEKTTKEDRE